jgi:type IV pilus assembly protein PilO
MAASPLANLSLSKLSLPAKVGVGIFAVASIGVLYWVVFFTDVSSKIDAAANKAAQMQTELATQQQAQASYLVDRDELVMRQQRQRELNKVLPADSEAAAFLSSIQQVSNVSGIELQGWKPEEEQAQQFFAKVPMRLELSGRFHQIAKFMYEVGRLDRIINVENIELADPKVSGDDVVLKVKCLATTFHSFKPKTAPAAAAAPAASGAPAVPAPTGTAPAPTAHAPGGTK